MVTVVLKLGGVIFVQRCLRVVVVVSRGFVLWYIRYSTFTYCIISHGPSAERAVVHNDAGPFQVAGKRKLLEGCERHIYEREHSGSFLRYVQVPSFAIEVAVAYVTKPRS